MEVVVQKKDLNKVLTKIQNIPEQRNLASPLANCVLQCQDQFGLKVCAQSYEAEMEVLCPAQVVEEGQLTLSARSLFDAVRALPDAPITIKSEPNYWASVVAGRTKIKVPGVDPDTMPARRTPNPTDILRLPVSLAGEMFEAVAFAMSVDEGRPNLNGVFLKVDENEVVEAVATDGSRLARVVRKVEGKYQGKPVGVIVHRKGIIEMRRFLEQEDGEVEIGFERENITFRTPQGFLLVRQVELEFPDYKRVLFGEGRWKFSAPRSELLDGVKRTSVVLSTDRLPVIRFTLEANRLLLSAKDPDKGEAETEIDCQYEGELFDIRYNSRYLIEGLSAMPGETVTFEVREQAYVTQISTPDDEGVMQLLMPIRD
jgi:DNA polymerase-3 subunit beta